MRVQHTLCLGLVAACSFSPTPPEDVIGPDVDAALPVVDASAACIDFDLDIAGTPARLTRTLLSYDVAKAECANTPFGSLAVLDNIIRLEAASMILAGQTNEDSCMTMQGPTACAWIGLDQAVDPNPSAGWRWVDGTPLADDGADWAPGQPDDRDGIENREEDCGRLTGQGPRYEDADCSVELIAICQCDAP